MLMLVFVCGVEVVVVRCKVPRLMLKRTYRVCYLYGQKKYFENEAIAVFEQNQSVGLM